MTKTHAATRLPHADVPLGGEPPANRFHWCARRSAHHHSPPCSGQEARVLSTSWRRVGRAMEVTRPIVVAMALALAGGTAAAQAPRHKPAPAIGAALPAPYEMRGIALGISLAAFRATPVIDDSGHWDLRVYCTGDHLPHGLSLDGIPSSREQLGVVSCQWFSRRKEPLVRHEGAKRAPAEPLERHWIDLGDGKGQPTFEFIDDGSGLRLFRISVFASSDYHPAIRSALTHKYGAPREASEPFQVKAGGIFPNIISSWSNGVSGIVLEERCRELERFCLTYSHTALTRVYDGRLEQRAAAAAGKI